MSTRLYWEILQRPLQTTYRLSDLICSFSSPDPAGHAQDIFRRRHSEGILQYLTLLNPIQMCSCTILFKHIKYIITIYLNGSHLNIEKDNVSPTKQQHSGWLRKVSYFKQICNWNKHTKTFFCSQISTAAGKILSCDNSPPFSREVTETASVIKALLSLGPIGSPGPPAIPSELLPASETREMAMLMGAGIVTQRHPFTS